MSNLFDRMKLFVQRDKEFRSALYDIMGFYPHDVELYRIAFAHKSQEYKSKRTGDRPLNNERLEFLGDAVLETVVSDIVYHHFKNKREGFLTNTRSKIVSRESLGKLAKDLGIDRLIQSHTTSRAHNSFLAGNAFEALMGAIYLDRGFDYAFRFIEHRIMGSVLDLEGVAHKEVNFKSKLLEWSQKNRIRIEYKDKQTNNSGTTPSFFTTIILEGLFAGDGKGFSKKEAHQNASKDALMRMRREPKFIDDIFSSKEKRTAMEADPCFVLPVIDEIEADLAREAEQQVEQQGKRDNKQKRDAKSKKEQPASKKEQPKAEPKKQEKKAEKPEPKKEQPASKKEQPKAEAKKQEKKAEKPELKADQPKAEKDRLVTKPQGSADESAKADQIKIDPIVVPIALEEIFDEPSSDNAVKPAEKLTDAVVTEAPIATAAAPEAVVEAAASEAAVEAAASEAVVEAAASETAVEAAASEATTVEAAASEAAVEAAAAEAAASEVSAPAKKARRRGKRQNAAGFTNTEIIPAETSHRAEKAAKKVEEAKKEKARRIAKKTAKVAAKGIVDDTNVPQNASADNVPQQNGSAGNAAQNASAGNAVNQPASADGAEKKSAKAKPAKKGKAAKTAKDSAAKTAKDGAAETPAKAPAKKPRRRKTKAELPSETPNPERERAITAAEEAAYRQTNKED